ncbi:hypothetical protein MsAg5_00730 [Methanosarcinaceae archaeon Ag5]|uniref:Uncharacterized protein n=1 Tax=Methanolapillus africanus TaxID=3028297 RepID=A0AAE4SEF3_9EURY|nr:hypothetical protein [Methanosarcinaceae archaeon Ag5]
MECMDLLLKYAGFLAGALTAFVGSYFGLIRWISKRFHKIELLIQTQSHESELKIQQANHLMELEFQSLKFKISNLSRENKKRKNGLKDLNKRIDFFLNQKESNSFHQNYLEYFHQNKKYK